MARAGAARLPSVLEVTRYRGWHIRAAAAAVLASIGALLVGASFANPALAVLVPLTITKSFSQSTVTSGVAESSAILIMISNPNASTVTGIAMTDTFPVGLTRGVRFATTVTPL